MFKRSLGIQTLLIIGTLISSVGTSLGAVECRSSLLPTTEQTIGTKIQDLTQQIDALLEVADRRIDIEITELIIKDISPLVENSSKVLRDRAILNGRSLSQNLGIKANDLANSAEKNLTKLGKLTARSLGLQARLMKLVPGLLNSRIGKYEKRFSLQRRELNELSSSIRSENSDFVNLESSLKIEIQNLEQAEFALTEFRDNLQNRIWQLEKSTKNSNNFQEKQMRQNLIETIGIIERQMQGIAELKTVGIALHAQINSTLSWNRSALESVSDLLGKKIGIVQALSTRPLNLEAAPLQSTQHGDFAPANPMKSNSSGPARKSVPDSEVDEVLALTKQTSDHGTHNLILNRFVDQNYRSLSVDQAIRLAKGSTQYPTHNSILKKVFDASIANISMTQAIQIAKATTDHNVHNSILLQYADLHNTDLSLQEAISLAKATTQYPTQDKILLQFLRSRLNTLQVNEVVSLATLASNWSTTDTILIEYVSSRLKALSNSDLMSLASKGSRSTADRILSSRGSF